MMNVQNRVQFSSYFTVTSADPRVRDFIHAYVDNIGHDGGRFEFYVPDTMDTGMTQGFERLKHQDRVDLSYSSSPNP